MFYHSALEVNSHSLLSSLTKSSAFPAYCSWRNTWAKIILNSVRLINMLTYLGILLIVSISEQFVESRNLSFIILKQYETNNFILSSTHLSLS